MPLFLSGGVLRTVVQLALPVVLAFTLPSAQGAEADASNTQAGEEIFLTPVQVLGLAQALYGKGQVDEAEKIYRSLLQSSAADNDIRIESAFQIGQIHISRGQYREAALYFVSILNEHPDLPRVRLELARAYFLDKNYPDATLQFELVKGGNLPPEVLANVDAFLDAIRRQKNWTVDFSLSPVLDSNINQASGRQECINTVFGTLCRPVNKKSSGVGLNIGADIDYFRRVSQDWGLRASAGFSALEYKGRDFDDYSLYAAVGPRYLWGSGEASLQPTVRKRWYAGKPYREEYGLRLDGSKIFSRTILSGGASYIENRYSDTLVRDVLDGTSWGLSLQPRYILNDRSFVQAGLSFLREDTRNAAYANDDWTTSLGYYRILPYGFSVFLQGSFTQTKYHDLQLRVSKDYMYDWAIRRDKTLGMTVLLSSNRLEKYGLTPIVQYSYVQRASNFWSQEYKRSRLDLLLRLRI